ncbi:flavodoxin [Aureimonas pseudogalii]|uniref:Flavodoxin n=1 Tax=Aureimonas pseudogalii TaxID=1744844 RepID=A0A7W6H3L6_9HYPH|nr:flavodoxin [Aureimonas pseudogalii]MBB3997292.1 flavodoxin [Aureimonas pseudogalii]
MTSTKTISRRQALKGSLALPLAAGMGSLTTGTGPASATGRTSSLVAYFTRTGNTRLIATQIARAQGATLFQIVPRDPYPEDYEEQVAQAEDERRRAYLPPLRGTVPDFDGFDTVYLGFPIWGTTAPSVIRSFLRAHDMSGKRLAPFVTHGGYGLGSSLAVVAEQAPGARLADAFSKECDQERETLREVTQWLDGTAR